MRTGLLGVQDCPKARGEARAAEATQISVNILGIGGPEEEEGAVCLDGGFNL